MASKWSCDARESCNSRGIVGLDTEAQMFSELAGYGRRIKAKAVSQRDGNKGISVKTLIDKEMSKELESRNQPPNVVPKLIGLNTLRQMDALDLAPQVIYSTQYSQSSKLLYA
ncbi:hypothetical protein Drorol1_Dr00021802 [Drosera rotundifolia]